MKLPYGWKPPEALAKRLGKKRTGRQRAICEDGHLLLVLHRAPDKDEREPEGLLFWRDEEAKWKANVGGGLGSLQEHVEGYAKLAQQLDEKRKGASAAADYLEVLEIVAPLTRAAENQYLALQSAREQLGPESDLLDLRDEAYAHHRALELLYEDAKHSMEYDIARRAEEQAVLGQQALESSHKLNMLMALFLPLTAIASVFGMNLTSGWETESYIPFWFIAINGFFAGLIFRNSIKPAAVKAK